MKCPICLRTEFEELLQLECGRVDNSFLYDPLVVICCCGCGHIMNLVEDHDKQNLIKYYETEYPGSNLRSPNTGGDLPGSSNENSMARYSILFNFIRKYLYQNDKILDIGCATGGFLQFLNRNGYDYLHGIDISAPYVETAKAFAPLEIKQGAAEKIPYETNTFDLAIADQVIEHLFDPNEFFAEAKRVIKHGGYLCISVPDSMLYDKYPFFDFYWFLMREHVQHFDLEHLLLIAINHGFVFIDSATSCSKMISEKMILPSLSLLFKNNGCPNRCMITRSFNLRYKMKEYIEHEKQKLLENKRRIKSIKDASDIPLYVFGISREFLYLYKNTDLSQCNIAGLIDDTEYKQKFFTVDGLKIEGSSILINSKNRLLITATAHNNRIKNILKKLNFEGEIIEV